MAPPRVVMAMQAMKAIGIPSQTVKPVLKNLLKVYDNNWELIEEESYRALADAIFEFQEEEVRKRKVEKRIVEDQNKEPWTDDAHEPRRTIKQLQQVDDHSSPSMCNPGIVLGKASLERQKLDEAASAETCLRQEKTEAASTQTCLAEKRKNLVSTQADVREKRQKLDEAASAETCLRQEKPEAVSTQTCLAEKRKNPVSTQAYVREKRPERVSPPLHVGGEGIESVSFQTHRIEQRTEPVLPPINPRGKSSASERNDGMNCFKWPKIEPSTEPLPDGTPSYHLCSTLIKPKSEPFSGDIPHFEVPIAVVLPPTLDPARKKAPDSVNQVGALIASGTTKRTGPTDSLTLNYADKEDEMQDSLPDITMNNETGLELVTVPEASPGNIEIASSTFGEVKLSLTFNSVLDRSDFHIPNLDAVLKLVEDKFLNTYRIAEPSFSAMKLMKELCQCFLELGSDSNDGKMERNVNVNLAFFDSLKESNIENFSDANGNLHISNFNKAANLSNGLANGHCLFNMVAPEVPRSLLLNGNNGLFHHSQPILRTPVCFNGDKDKEELEGSEPAKVNSQSVVVAPQCCLSLDDEIPLHDVNDICKGEERVRISVANEVSSEQYPPSFYYIPQNIVYQNAYLNFSLARIGDENCCSDCFGNCLSSAIPCACARETGGEYAYTLDGLIKKEFLDDSISLNRHPQKHRLFYCKDCPLERSKNEVQPDACKGHLVRKFIKECWSKCGCNKQCGNRVVQRGITRNLQVFLTSGGKGWGVRTLEELPRGTFICEYVGEVVTNMELYDRTIQITGKERHTYPVLLDADWGSEGVLKDEEALCLDATFYGNVGRFINHRCYDANLIEIPVEVETPDHHYYHLAFFTTRKVEALEELTWDYGIDFDDHTHPVKAFRCRCGSRFCRDVKPSTRKRQRGVILR